MVAVAGLRGTGDWGTDERPKNFRETILKLAPNGMSPIFALSARIAKEMTDDAEFTWWSEPQGHIRLLVNGALSSSDTLVTIDSGDPTASDLTVQWGLAKHLVPGDVLMVEPATDSATFNHELVRVTEVHSDTQFSVTRGVGGTTPASIADNANLIKVGTAFAEGTGAPRSATRNPIKFFNYTQIFKTTYEITGTAEQTKLRTGDPVSVDKARKMFDHSRDIEMALLFGRKAETTGENGKPLRYTAGIRSYVSADTTTILAANWSIANPASAGNSLLDAISPVFNYDTRAGDERIVFCGNGALNAINAAIHKASGVGATTIQFKGGEKVYGMNFTRMTLPQGSIFLKTHPLMNLHPLWNYSMLILDFSALKYRPMKSRDTKSMDNIQNKDEDLRRGQWLTEMGLEVHHGGLTLGYIGGFNAAIA